MAKLINIIGMKFGKLTVEKIVGKTKTRDTLWKCNCDCGEQKIVCGGKLKSGHTKSCGCLKNGNTNAVTHGKHSSRTYKSWNAMKNRCTNKNVTGYKYWGGRGITICDDWMKFENFYSDMGDRPLEKSLDRINNNGNYEPSNCRWATSKEQNNNTSRSKSK